MSEKKSSYHILQKMVFVATGATEIVDKATSWAAAGISALLVLMISNVEKLNGIFCEFEIKMIIALLSIALFFGLLEKFYFVKTFRLHKINSELEPYMSENLKNKTIELKDIESALSILREKIVPWYGKRKFDMKIIEAQNDMHTASIDLGISFNRQGQAAVGMIIMICTSIIYTIYAL